MQEKREPFLYSDQKACFLVTLVIEGRSACAWPLPDFGLIFSWQVRTGNPIPQVIAQDLILADDEASAREHFFAEFWENEISIRKRKRTSRDIRAFARVITEYYRHRNLPTGLWLQTELYSRERIEKYWAKLYKEDLRFRSLHPRLGPVRLPRWKP